MTDQALLDRIKVHKPITDVVKEPRISAFKKTLLVVAGAALVVATDRAMIKKFGTKDEVWKRLLNK